MQSVVDLVLLATLWATAVSIGARTRLDVSVQPRGWYVRAIVLNVVGVPLLAALVALVLGLSLEVRAALVLVGAAAGGALGLTTSRLAGGDASRSLLLILVLELGNLVLIPLWTLLLLSTWAPVPVVDVARTLLLALGLPLLIGILVRRRIPALAPAMARVGSGLASIGLLVVIGLLLLMDVGPLVDSGDGLDVILAGLVFISATLLAGAVLGGPGADGRAALATVTAARSSALALVIAREAYADRQMVVAAVVFFGLIGVVLPVVCATLVGVVRRRSAGIVAPATSVAREPPGAEPAG